MFSTRRIAASIAALTIVGASVALGTLPAAAYAPTSVSIDPLGFSVQTDNGPVSLSGLVDHSGGGDQTVEVSVSFNGGAPQAYCSAEITIYDPVAADVPWSCSSYAISGLDYGTAEFTAISYEYATPAEVSPVSDTLTLTVGSTDPVVIVSPTDGTSTLDPTPTFTGTGPHMGSVQVYADAVAVCSSPVDANGDWSCTSSPLASYVTEPIAFEVTYAITATGTAVDGTPQAGAGPQNLTIRMPETPTVDQTFDPWYTGEAAPVVQGNMGQYTTSVTVWRSTNGSAWWWYCNASTSELGTTWSCDPATDMVADELDYGLNYLAASTTNEQGQLSTLGPQIEIYRLVEPTVTVPANEHAYTSDPTPTFTGTADALTTSIEVREGSSVYCTAVPVGGDWSCTPLTPFGDGTYDYFVGYDPEPGGFTQIRTITVDTVDPIDPGIFDPGTVYDTTPTINGTAEDGATVTVYVDGAPAACTSPAVGDAGGNWSCELANPLDLGPHSLSAVQTDRAGNTSSEGVPPVFATVTVETPPAPPTPTISSPSNDFETYLSSIAVEGYFENVDSLGYVARVTATWADGSDTCDDTVEYYESDWACSVSVPAGPVTITAVLYPDDGLFENPSDTSTAVTGTRLAYTKPTVTYGLGPASIAVNASADPWWDISVEVYAVEVFPDEVGDYYDYTLLSTCGTGGEGGGEGASGETSFAMESTSCNLGGLAPGIYNVYSNQYSEGGDSPYQNDYILIPETPTLAVVSDEDGATFSGGGTPGYRVEVRDAADAPVCGAIVQGSGAWSCSVDLEPGEYSFRAVQRAQGFVADTGNPSDVPDRSLQGFSALTGIVSAVIESAATPPATPAFAAWTFLFGFGGGQFQPGDSTTLTGSGLPAGATVEAELHSTPADLGETVVDAEGSFTLPVTIPLDAEPGEHEFVVTVTPLPGTGIPSTSRQTVTILDPPRNRAEPSPEAIEAVLAELGGADGDRSDPAAPTSLTTVLEPAQNVLTNPVALGGAAVAGLVLLLLVGLPAELLNQSISENYERITRRLPRVRAPWWQRFGAWIQSRHLIGGLALTVLAALIFGFADPGFGWDVASARLVLALALALFVVGYLASLISGAIIRRRWGLESVMELKPLGILLAVVGVLLSRIIEFSPGFLIGLVLGITVLSTTSAAQRAKVTLVQAGVVFGLSMLGWAAYSILSATTSPDSFATALAFETTAAITAEGLTALVVGMLPFKLLDGSEVAAYSRWLWAAVYAFIAGAWILVVLPSAWTEQTGSIWTTVAVLGAFTIVALGIYFFFRLTGKDEDEEDDPTTPQDESELEDVVL